MAINKNHEAEELDGVKCAVVEKEASADRVGFLKSLLEFNGYAVVVVASPPPKTVPAAKPAAPKPVVEGEVETAPAVAEIPAPPPPPSTFTIGVTNLMFNTTNALFGRQLHTKDGHVVTPHYWQQKEAVSHDEIPYYQQ